jgi:hypothetical protein
MYSSASDFECQTTCAHHHKPENSFKIVVDGQPTTSLHLWVKGYLGPDTPYKLTKSSKREGPHISAAYRSLVRPLGSDGAQASDAAGTAVKR